MLKLKKSDGGALRYGRNQPAEIELLTGVTIVGRGGHGEFVHRTVAHPEAHVISRVHVSLRMDPGCAAVRVLVLGKHGMLVNGESYPQGSETELVDGDEIGFSSQKCRAPLVYELCLPQQPNPSSPHAT